MAYRDAACPMCRQMFSGDCGAHGLSRPILTPTVDCSVCAAKDAEIARLKAAETPLRRWLWLNHGCRFNVLYGDDGEMQCNNAANHPSKMFLDFRRNDLPSLLIGAIHGVEMSRESEIARLTALLREGEWEGSCATPRGTLVFVCSRCGRARHEGHAIDCRLKAALTGRGEA